MPDISKFRDLSGNLYNIKDAIHRSDKNNPHKVTAKQAEAVSLSPDYQIEGDTGWYRFFTLPIVDLNRSRKIVLMLTETYQTVSTAIVSMFVNRPNNGVISSYGHILSSIVIRNTDLAYVIDQTNKEVLWYYRKRCGTNGVVNIQVLESTGRNGTPVIDVSSYFESEPIANLPSNAVYFLPCSDGAGNYISTTYATKSEVSELDAEDVGAQPTITVSGILKGNGSGGVSAAEPGTDYATPSMIPAVPSAFTMNPQMDGTASPGSSEYWSRGDHVHPSDTSRVPITRTVNGNALSADIELNAEDIPYEGSVNGIVVTTVKGALDHIPTGSNISPYMDGIPSAGGSYYFSKSDHVHPSDTSRVPINRSVNGKELRDDIILSAADVGATSEGSIAPSELKIASTNYAIGDHLMLGGVLYEVIAAISSGETITPGTNVSATMVTGITDGLDARTTALEAALDGLVSQLAQT